MSCKCSFRGPATAGLHKHLHSPASTPTQTQTHPHNYSKYKSVETHFRIQRDGSVDKGLTV
ncbi:hypothetical protein I79_009381 [Cricetulus griseus]|uniref:Uncharacterized protein n=1 Tax=Cricetulus griseus TaxID=10029 RepID=G3HFL9_CRIGR|nr:hypothetical protein I79_009381 [Cricetulus griseus]